jgi:hypothetical protein
LRGRDPGRGRGGQSGYELRELLLIQVWHQDLTG